MGQESIEQHRATCMTRNKLGYCNVPDEDCPRCKAYDYDPLSLIIGHSWEEIQDMQHKVSLHKTNNIDTSE
jgi:hypothetical protein